MPARRRVLAALAASTTTVVGGCQSLGSQTPTRESTAREPTARKPTAFAEGTAGPATSCDERIEPLDPYWTAAGPGPRDGFRLTASADRVALGDDVTVALTNVTDSEQESGNRKKFDLQRLDDDRWRTVFGIETGTSGHLDDLVGHAPGEGFEWTLTLSKDGLTDAHESVPTYYVCGDLEPGRYRFVYWGVSRSDAHAIPIEVRDA